MDFETVNKKYRELWKEYLANTQLTQKDKEDMHLNRWPMQYPSKENVKKSILFVGFNPSHDDKESFLKIDMGTYKNPSEILDDSALIRQIIDYERDARSKSEAKKSKYNPYYARFPEIAREAMGSEDKWFHLDLLPMRDKKQAVLINSLKLNPDNLFDLNKRSNEQFILDNLSVFADAVNLLDPPAIVIANGYVSKSVIANYGFIYRSVGKSSHALANGPLNDDLNRIFRIRCDNFKETGARKLFVKGKEYPLLLTSMLTEQHALDLGSRERLIWHLKLLLGK